MTFTVSITGHINAPATEPHAAGQERERAAFKAFADAIAAAVAVMKGVDGMYVAGSISGPLPGGEWLSATL